MTWEGTLETVTDIQNIDTNNFPNYICLYLLQFNSWYYLNKFSAENADEELIITANPNGRWKKINTVALSVNDTNLKPQNSPQRKNEMVYFTSSQRLFLSTGINSINNWKELPYRSLRFGSGHPSNSENLSPYYEGEVYLDTSQNRLYISTDGTSWSLVSITDGRTNALLDASLLASTPTHKGDIVYDESNEEGYVSIGTSSSSDWINLNFNEVKRDDINNSPQNVPNKINELLYLQQNNKLFISIGTSSLNDWKQIYFNDLDIVSSKPSIPSDSERRLFLNSINNQLYGYDGNEVKLISDIENKNNFLKLDVNNNAEFSNFVDITSDIEIQIYFIPYDFPLFYYDGTSIIYTKLSQWNRAPWTNTGGTSANDYKATHITSTDISNAQNNNDGIIDLSTFFANNGLGKYFFIPCNKDTVNNKYIPIGNNDNVINLGLEFVNNNYSKNAKILDAKYDDTEFNLSNPPSQLSKIRGDFGSYDLVTSTYLKTLSGGIKYLQLESYPIDITIQLRPYENLTNYGNFYAS